MNKAIGQRIARCIEEEANMKAVIRLSILFVVATTLTAMGCGGGRHLSQPGKLLLSTGDAQVRLVDGGFTEEDYLLMEMSYQERLAYLEQRYKELVYQFHGVVLEDSLVASKTASDYVPTTASEAQAVQKLYTYYEYSETRENLRFRWNDETRTWELSFYERLCGDFNLDSKVVIADITALAQNYGAERDENGNWPEAYLPQAPHIDRNSNSDGEINIADVTCVAVNFGLKLKGYKVYYEGAETVEIAEVRHEDNDPYPLNTRFEWERVFSEDYICETKGLEPDAETDKLYVRALIQPLGTGEREWPEPNELSGFPPEFLETIKVPFPNRSYPPTAVLVVTYPPSGDPPALSIGQEFTFDGSDSVVWDEDWVTYGLYVYEFDYGDGSEPYVHEPQDPHDPGSVTATHSYDDSGTYTVKLTVTQRDTSTPPVEARDAATTIVKVKGAPDTTLFTAELDPQDKPTEEYGLMEVRTGEVTNTVTYSYRVVDTDGGIEEVYIDYIGDKSLENLQEWTLLADFNGEEDTGVCTHEHIFYREDIANQQGPLQEKPFDSQLAVVQTGTGLKKSVRLSDHKAQAPYSIGPEFILRRAKPLLSLMTVPEADVYTIRYDDDEGNPQVEEYWVVGVAAGDQVTFDTRQSTDQDGEPLGEALVPTEFEFNFGAGEGPSVFHDYDDPPANYGMQSHTYNTPGKYTATVYARDYDYYENLVDVSEAERHAAHEESRKVVVYVYGNITSAPLTSGWVDDGDRPAPDGHWTELGDVGIAVDVDVNYDDTEELYEDKMYGLPGVVYYSGTVGPTFGLPDIYPSPFYIKMNRDGTWPSEPERVRVVEDANLYIGYQCDLEYTSIHLPWIAATWQQPLEGLPLPGQYGGLMWYAADGANWGSICLLADFAGAAADAWSPIRLVVSESSFVVHYSHWNTIAHRHLGLFEVACTPDIEPEVRYDVTVEPGETIASHDAKRWKDLVDGDGIPRSGNAHSMGYPLSLRYEWRDDADGWTGSGSPVSGDVSAHMTRLIALDYYDPTKKDQSSYKLGVCWIAAYGDLMFCECSCYYEHDIWLEQWSEPEQVLSETAVAYCDFDYLPGGVPVLAYQVPSVGSGPIVLRAAMCLGGNWSTKDVDNSVGADTHLDMDVFDGYQYVVYSKAAGDGSNDVRCAILDFFNGNR